MPGFVYLLDYATMLKTKGCKFIHVRFTFETDSQPCLQTDMYVLPEAPPLCRRVQHMCCSCDTHRFACYIDGTHSSAGAACLELLAAASNVQAVGGSQQPRVLPLRAGASVDGLVWEPNPLSQLNCSSRTNGHR